MPMKQVPLPEKFKEERPPKEVPDGPVQPKPEE